MYIEELKEGGSDDKDEEEEESVLDVSSHGEIRLSDAKRALIVVGSRFLFYPTLLYNVIRNKIQSEFHWWDLIDEVQSHCILLLQPVCLQSNYCFLLKNAFAEIASNPPIIFFVEHGFWNVDVMWLLPVCIVRCCSISYRCSSLKANWCSWGDHIE